MTIHTGGDMNAEFVLSPNFDQIQKLGKEKDDLTQSLIASNEPVQNNFDKIQRIAETNQTVEGFCGYKLRNIDKESIVYHIENEQIFRRANERLKLLVHENPDFKKTLDKLLKKYPSDYNYLLVLKDIVSGYSESWSWNEQEDWSSPAHRIEYSIYYCMFIRPTYDFRIMYDESEGRPELGLLSGTPKNFHDQALKIFELLENKDEFVKYLEKYHSFIERLKRKWK